MSKPGAVIPLRGVAYTVGTTEGVKVPKCSVFRISVATPGNLHIKLRGTPDETQILNFPIAGVYEEPGEFQEIWMPGGDALVTAPATTINLFTN